MRPDDEACAAVDEMTEALLLARRLRVEVEDDRIRLFLQRTGGEDGFRALEGIVEFRMHEHAAHDVGDEDPGAVAGVVDAGAPAGRARRIVRRAQELLMAVGEDHRLLLVPDVVAGRHNVRAGIDRLQEDVFRDPETAGGVLAVDDDEIQPEIGNEARKPFPDRGPPALADHITEKQKPHACPIISSFEVAQATLGQHRRKPDVVRFGRD